MAARNRIGAGRVVARPTKRGIAVLVASAVLFGTGLLLGHPLTRALAGAGFGAVCAALVFGAARPRVTVTREVYPDRVSRGRHAVARLRVANPSTRWQPGFVAGDRVGCARREVAIHRLPPGGETVQHYELPTGDRGRHRVGPLVVERFDPFGLGVRRTTTGDTTTLWVHPAVHPMRAPAGGAAGHHHEGGRGTSPGSHDLREVREYVPGDEVRLVHWKATARTGRLMVRDHADPDPPAFTVVLDTRGGRWSAALFEEAADLAASLLSAAAGRRRRLVTSCGTDVRVPAGAAHARGLLDVLAEVDPGVDGPLCRPFGGAGGGLAVVTADVRPEDLGVLGDLGRRHRGVVVFCLGATDCAPVPGVDVLPAADAADAARRWNAARRGDAVAR